MKPTVKFLAPIALAGLLIGVCGGYSLMISLSNINNKEKLTNMQSKRGAAMLRSGEPRIALLMPQSDTQVAKTKLSDTLSTMISEHDKYLSNRQNAITQRKKVLTEVSREHNAAAGAISETDVKKEAAKTTTQIQSKTAALTKKKNEITLRLKGIDISPADFAKLTSEHKRITDAITELETAIQSALR